MDELSVRGERLLTREDFQRLSDVPPEMEWFANITNPHTRRAYRNDLNQFVAFVGIQKPEEFRGVRRPHVIAWRKDLEARKLAPATIRRKLSPLSDLFNHLCESNAILHNPVSGVERPGEGANEGKTPAISDDEARMLLAAPDATKLKGNRDRAILAVLLYDGLRRSELCALRVKDVGSRRGIPTLTVQGQRSKIRYIPLHPAAMMLLNDYLENAVHRSEPEGALFRAVRAPASSALSGEAVLGQVVMKYARKLGIQVEGKGVHALRATAATNALEHEADIAKVQEWLGSSIATTRLYDRRAMRPENSPTFKVEY